MNSTWVTTPNGAGYWLTLPVERKINDMTVGEIRQLIEAQFDQLVMDRALERHALERQFPQVKDDYVTSFLNAEVDNA